MSGSLPGARRMPAQCSASSPGTIAPIRRRSSIRGLRIGFDARWSSDGVDLATQQVLGEAIEVLRAIGARIVDTRFPDVRQTVADWVPNCAVEAAVAHEATYPSRKDEYGPVLAAVIE